MLLLDEPTRAIDMGSRAQIYETIALRRGGGRVLLVSSYLPELFGMCDRLAVMSGGRLSPAPPIEEWTPEAVLATAVGGGARSVVSLRPHLDLQWRAPQRGAPAAVVPPRERTSARVAEGRGALY